MQIAPDPVEHLKFETVSRDVIVLRETFYPVDDPFIMCGNRGVITGVRLRGSQQVVREPDVMMINIGFFSERDFRRFQVGAFYKALSEVLRR